MASTEALMPLHHQPRHDMADMQMSGSSGMNSQNSGGEQSSSRTGGKVGGGGRTGQYAFSRGQNYSKPRRVVFYKNGDRYFGGKWVTVPHNRHYSIRDLMRDLSKSVDLPYGVRRVYTPVSGREINNIDELVDGSSYVCASFEPFRSVRYGDYAISTTTANSNYAG